jgi:hypothetical protein
MKNLHLNSTHTCHINVLRFESMLPWNCIWYADLTEYSPVAVLVQTISFGLWSEGPKLVASTTIQSITSLADNMHVTPHVTNHQGSVKHVHANMKKLKVI